MFLFPFLKFSFFVTKQYNSNDRRETQFGRIFQVYASANKILPSNERYSYNMHLQCNYVSKAITTVHISSRLNINNRNEPRQIFAKISFGSTNFQNKARNKNVGPYLAFSFKKRNKDFPGYLLLDICCWIFVARIRTVNCATSSPATNLYSWTTGRWWLSS